MSSTSDPATGRPRGVRPPAFIYGIIGVLVAVLLLGAGAFLWLARGGTASLVGGSFTLEDGSGKQVTDRDLRGKYLLIYFGYTFCPDVCPTTLTETADALDRLGPKADRLQPIFITVDPKRDTPAVVKQYAAAFSPRLIGLTGSPEQIAQVAKEYRVYYAEHRTGPGPGDYTMDHSSILYLMGPDGNFIAPIRADETGAEMAADIAKFIS
jgi:protein SCO1